MSQSDVKGEIDGEIKKQIEALEISKKSVLKRFSDFEYSIMIDLELNTNWLATADHGEDSQDFEESKYELPEKALALNAIQDQDQD